MQQVRSELEESLNNAPQESVRVLKSGGRVQCYLRSDKSDKNGVYVPKKQISKLKKYIQNDYNAKALKLINEEICNLQSYLKKSSTLPTKIKLLYSNYPQEIKQLICPIDCMDEEYVKEWLSRSFVGKKIPDSLPIFETNNGERVRSKSELSIANALLKYGVPYKYECPLTLKGGIVVHPDFSVLHVKKRKIIYWEHRGMMDEREYARESVNKIKEYNRNGIVLGDNLIITEETSSNPLGTNEIEMTIQRILLQ